MHNFRSSKDFPDMHSLIMHTYNSDNPDLRVDHLGLHKALCVLMGWDYLKPPDNSKAYQFLSAEEAAANVDDLVIWPPVVIIHNTVSGKSKDGRMEGLGNKAMDSIIRGIVYSFVVHNVPFFMLFLMECSCGEVGPSSSKCFACILILP